MIAFAARISVNGFELNSIVNTVESDLDGSVYVMESMNSCRGYTDIGEEEFKDGHTVYEVVEVSLEGPRGFRMQMNAEMYGYRNISIESINEEGKLIDAGSLIDVVFNAVDMAREKYTCS